MRRLVDTSAFVNPAGQLLLTRRGKTRMDGVGIVFELYIAPLSTGICVSALVFSWLNKMFPSTTTTHLYYYQCRWHTVDINGVRRRKSDSAFTPRSVFQDGIDKPGLVSDTRHHEDNPAAQATFLWHVESLVSSRPMSEIGNPSMDLIGDLVVLDTIVVADCTIVESVQTIEKIGQQRCDSFYQDRLIARTK